MDVGQASVAPSHAEAPIGLFDSGMGGLAVLRELMRLLPHENVLYVGDTARRPYGPQPVEAVESYAVEITGYLVDQGAKAVIIGCNTASVAGAEAARRCFPAVPVLDMVEPGVKAAINATETGRIGVWGTALTVEKKAYDDAITEISRGARVCGVACPDLLRLAEEGEIGDRARLTEMALEYVEPIDQFGADVLVLGCTDLTCVRDITEAAAGEGVVVVDPAEEVVSQAKRVLESMGSLRTVEDGPSFYEFLVTGHDEDEFAAFATEFLELPSVNVRHVPLETIQAAKACATGSSD